MIERILLLVAAVAAVVYAVRAARTFVDPWSDE